MGRRASAIAVATILALGALPACGAAHQPGGDGGVTRSRAGGKVALSRIGNFDRPTYVAGAPGFPSLLFVVEQPGRVMVLRNGHELKAPFLDLTGLVGYDGDERGLLSIAFPPDYAQSRRFYVYYTDNDGNIRIDEFKRRSATRAARSSRRAVVQIPHPTNANHNGGQLQFLGNLLYFGTGDGGSGGDPPNNAQNKDVLLGKLLRIDPRADGGRRLLDPAQQPLRRRTGARRDLQLRAAQPVPLLLPDDWRPHSARIAIADVGQDRIEELDYTTVAAASGANFGWDAFEGFAPYTGDNSGTPDPGGTVKPIFAYNHDRGGGSCSIIGGYVVRDRRLPSLYGRYLYADLCEGRLRSLVPHPGRATGDRKLGLSVSSPSQLRRGRHGARLRLLAGWPRLPARARPLTPDAGEVAPWRIAAWRSGQTCLHRKESGDGERHGRERQANRRPADRAQRRGREPRGPQPGDRRRDRARADRLPAERRRDGGAGPRQPARVGGARDRGPLPLAGQAARLAARQPRPGRRHDAGGDRQGPRRRLQRGRSTSPT